MPYTCIAFDGSAPEQIQQAIKLHLDEDHLDTHMSCLLEDAGGQACDGRKCGWSGAKGKRQVPEWKDRKHNPKPHVDPPARPPKSKAAKRKPAAKSKAKKGRRK